jgi:Protein of unknown function (DUF629)
VQGGGAVKCRECDEVFESEDDARHHVADRHSAEVDEKLMEYLSDAIEDAYGDLIDESDN